MSSIAHKFYSNDWIYPTDKFAHHEWNLKEMLQRRIGTAWDFSESDWERACHDTDRVLKLILTELRNQAQKHFEGLNIHTEVLKQASARQGLKINAPDEFDALVPFTIEGLLLHDVRLTDISDQYLPGQIRIRVQYPEQIESFPSLKKAGVFEMDSGTYFINTKALQEHVFKFLIDKALDELTLKTRCVQFLCAMTSTPYNSKTYTVSRGSRPPTMDLSIQVDTLETFDVDFVPALVLSAETIYIPGSVLSSVDTPIQFQRYGLMKWVNKKNLSIDEDDKNFIWRSCSSSYERFMFDFCDGNDERSYIKTSCRVMKALVKQLRRRQNRAAILLSSYHLKTIAMYCILLLTVPSKLTSSGSKLSGVREALGYFLTFLEMVLERKCLPDFFLGNEYLNKIFPDSYFSNIHIKYNLFNKEDPGTVEAAKFGFPDMKRELEGCFEDRNLNARVVKFFAERTLNV